MSDYVSQQSMQVSTGSASHEVVVYVHLTCTVEGSPGFFNPATGGEPPSGPEFDVDRYVLQAEGDAPDVEVPTLVFPHVFGVEVEEQIFEAACEEAAETGDFG